MSREVCGYCGCEVPCECSKRTKPFSNLREAMSPLAQELARLRAENAELREALQQLVACHDEPSCPALDVACAVLAKHNQPKE